MDGWIALDFLDTSFGLPAFVKRANEPWTVFSEWISSQQGEIDVLLRFYPSHLDEWQAPF